MSAAVPALPKAFPDAATAQRRVSETVNNILGFQHDDSRIQTAAEVSAGVTPVNYAYAPYDARRYGADPTGATDSTAALNLWLTAVQQATNGSFTGQSFKAGYLAGGTYLVSGALTAITANKIRIYGDGSDVSRLIVAGAGASFTVLQIGNSVPTSTVIQNIQVEGIGILRQSGSGAITLMKVINTQYSHYRDITLYDNTSTTGGVSLEYRGHENNTFENLWCQNVQPIILGNPSGNAGDGCDHTEWRGLEIQSSNDTQALITCVGANLTISNQAFVGNQIWLGGIFGFLYNDTGAGNSSVVGGDLLFENIRREQTSSSSSGDTIKIVTGGSSGGGTNNVMTNVVVRNCTFGLPGTSSGGLHFEGVNFVTLENVDSSIGSGVGVAFVARSGATGSQLKLTNCSLLAASLSLTNMEQVYGSNDLVLGANQHPTTVVYQYTDVNEQAVKGMTVYEGRVWVGKRTVANNGSFAIPGSSTSTAHVSVAASAGSGSVEGGSIVASSAATALAGGTTNFQASTGAGKLSVSWNGANYVVTNQLGSSRDITVNVTWM